MGKKMFRFIVTALVFLMLICVPASAATSSVTIAKGGTKQLKVKGTSIKKAVSSKKSVASVTNKGLVTAKKKGTAVITVTGKNNKKYKFHVTVEKPSLNKTSLTINQGKTYVLKLKNNTQKVKWSSSNKKVATVSSSGGVTAKSSGKAVITAKVPNGPSYKCRVTVKKVKAADTSSAPEEETEKQTTASSVSMATTTTSTLAVSTPVTLQGSGSGTNRRPVTIVATGDVGALRCSYSGKAPDNSVHYQSIEFGTSSYSSDSEDDTSLSTNVSLSFENGTTFTRYLSTTSTAPKTIVINPTKSSKLTVPNSVTAKLGTDTVLPVTVNNDGKYTIDISNTDVTDPITITINYEKNYKTIYNEVEYLNEAYPSSSATITFSTVDSSAQIYKGTTTLSTSFEAQDTNLGSSVIAVQYGLDKIKIALQSPLYIEDTDIEVYRRTATGERGEKIDATVIATERMEYNLIRTLQISGIAGTDDIIISTKIKYTETRLYVLPQGERYYDTTVSFENPGKAWVSSLGSTSFNTSSNRKLGGFYSGGKYTFTYDDPDNCSALQSMVLTYTDLNDEAKTETYTANDGKITFTMPFVKNRLDNNATLIMLNYKSKRTKIVLTFEKENKGKISIKDSVDKANYIGYYSSLVSEAALTGKRNMYYSLFADRTYILTNLYDGFDGNRLTLESFDIYQLNDDHLLDDYKSESWTLKEDEEGNYIRLPDGKLTGDGGMYYLTMPDYPIEIFPMYTDHLHRIDLIEDSGSESVGGVTLSGTASNHFFKKSGYMEGTANNASLTWSSDYHFACDNQTYTLTPNFDTDAYQVTSIHAYAYTRYDEITSYSMATTETDSYLVPLTENDIKITSNGDGTWAIKLMDGLSYKNLELFVKAEKIPESFVKFTYALDGTSSSGGMILNSKFEGKFVYTKAGDVTYPSTSTLTGVDMGQVNLCNTWNTSKVLDHDEVQKNSVITVTLGYDALKNQNTSDNAFRGSRLAYRNLIISLTDEQTGKVLSKFRYFGGEIYELSGEDTSCVSAPVTTRYFDDMLQSVTFNVSVGTNPLKLTIQYLDNYIPVTVNQKIIREDGTVCDAAEGDNIETTITKYASGYKDALAYQQKYFTNVYRDGDYYLGTDSADNYTDSFTILDDRESRNMLTQYQYSGLLVLPGPSDAYMLAGIGTETLNRSGLAVSTLDTNNSKNGITPDITYQKVEEGGANWVHFNSRLPLSQQLVVNVYYTQKTSLTVTQHDSGSSSRNKVVLSNYNEERAEVTKPYLLGYVAPYDNYTINETTNNSTGISTQFGVNRNTGIRLAVTPANNRNIAEVRAYRVLADDEEEELTVERVSGTAYPGKETVYRIKDYLVNTGDDIHVEITYGIQQQLTVRVMMLDDNNNLVANKSEARVKVTGIVDGTDTVFWRRTEVDGNLVDIPVEGNAFEVGEYNTNTEASEDSVYVYTTTQINLAPLLGNSDYRVANVVAYQLGTDGKTKGDPLTLTYPNMENGANGEISGIDFSSCTLPAMPKEQNVLITVYLARPVDMTVSIKYEDTDGEYKDGAPDNSYVNVYGENDRIGSNEYTIVTETSEGGFNTKSITITNNPSTRTVQIFQGATLEAFANVPLNEDWVIKKVEVVDQTDKEVGSLYTGESAQVTAADSDITYLRVKFGTKDRFLPDNNYKVIVYLAKAKSVYVSASITDSFAVPTQAGSVTVYGTNSEVNSILFTRIDPTGTTSENYYSAINTKRNDSYGYRSVTKAISGTEITVQVKPKNNYMIGSFTASDSIGGQLDVTASAPDGDGTVTYTLKHTGGAVFQMDKLADLLINVEFSPQRSSQVTIDYWYTDDYVTMYPAPGSQAATAYISQHYGSSVYPDEPTIYDAEKNMWVADLLDLNENGTYEVLVGTRLYLGLHLKEGKLYAPIENWVDRTNVSTGVTIRTTNNGMPTNGVNQDVTVKAGENLLCHILLAPISLIDLIQINRNVYGDSPLNTDDISTTCYSDTRYSPQALMTMQLDDSLTEAVANGMTKNGETVKIQRSITAPMYYDQAFRSTVFEYGANIPIFQGSKGMTVTLSEDRPQAPGEVISVKVYMGDEAVATLASQDGIHYTAPDNFVIDTNKHYKVVVTTDCVDVWTKTGETDANVYIVKPLTEDQDVKTINIYDPSTYAKLEQVRGNGANTSPGQHRLSKDWQEVTGNVYVIVQVNESCEDLRLVEADYRDYYDDYAADGKFDQKGGEDIEDELNANYYTVKDTLGYTRYCYAYAIDPQYPRENNLYPLDNSMFFWFAFSRPKTPNSHDKVDTPATVELWQELRTTNVGYAKTTQGTAAMTLTDDSQFTCEGQSVSVVQVPAGSVPEAVAGTFVGKTIRLKVTPPENCIVTKIVVTDENGTHEYKPKADNIYDIYVSYAREEIVVYYSWPQITVSTNNKSGEEKGVVSIDSMDNVIVDSGVYMGSTLVEKGEQKQLIIEPKTYETEKGVEDYQVAYVLLGREGRNSMLPISSDLIQPDENGRVIVDLGTIDTDVDVHVQFAKKTAAKTMTLLVSHYVWDSDEWMPCNATYHGTVTTTGALEGEDDPILDINGDPVNPLVLEEEPYVSATVIQGTQLNFTAKPSDLFNVDHISIRTNVETAGRTLDGTTVPGAERSFSFTAENYDVIYVDVYYKEPVYKLTYHGNNNTDGNAPDPVENCFYNEGLTIADQGTLVKARNTFLGWSKNPEATEPEFLPGAIFHITENTDLYAVWEPMTRHKLVYSYKNRFVNDLDEVANRQYIVFVWLDSDQKVKVQNTDGTYAEQPTKQILKENAPYIDDLYKDCKWDFDNAKTVDNVTTIPAIQTLKKYKIYWEIAEEKTGESSSGTIDVSELKETNTAEIVKNGRKITCHYVDHPYNVLCPLRAVKRNGVTDFLYWQATDVDANGNLIEGTTKPVCYTEYYSYRITKDIYVEPVYYGDGTKGWDLTLGETIYSREQYTGELEEVTEEGGNSTTGIEKTTVYDYVYTDYLISILSPYQELVDDINKPAQNENDESTQGEIKNIQFGLVLERDTSYEYDHDQNENVVYPEKAQEDICSLLDGKKAEIGSGTSEKVSAEEKNREYFIFDRTDSATLLTNKNRIDVYIRFANNELNPKYAYNVYAYMIITRDDAQTVIVSKDVSRLNIYDYGHRIYSAFEVLPEPEDPDSTEPETLPSSAAAPAALYSDVDYADDGLIEDAEDMSEDATDNWSDEREPDVQEETDTDGYPTDDAENEDAPEVLDDTVLENDTEEILE